jgi:hypothetical protein
LRASGILAEETVTMRAFVLLGLSAFTLAACDSPYGPPPSSASNKNYVTTGSHLQPRQDQPSNVQTLGPGNLGSGGNPQGKLPGAGA